MFRNNKGFTFVEVCVSIIILSIVFGVAATVMSYSRKETQKGFWIQQQIGALRNATRQIAEKLKAKSYPSTLVANRSKTDASKFNQLVISFKERREYDATGRLINLEQNESDAYEIHAAIDKGMIKPEDKQILLMYFPICEPERDFQDSYEKGKITWVRFVLEPSPTYSIYKGGTIFMEEYLTEYDTREYEVSRAYRLNEGFDMQTAKLIRRKEIISDVYGVELNRHKMNTKIGSFKTISYSANNERKINTHNFENEKNIINFKIYCSHPKDSAIKLFDCCSITANSEVHSL